jgi:hypothetical protein
MEIQQLKPAGMVVFGERRSRSRFFYVAAALFIILALCSFWKAVTLHNAEVAEPRQTSMGVRPTAQAPLNSHALVGDPGSTFDIGKYDENCPASKNFASAGVTGGIPREFSFATELHLSETDDIQARINSLNTEGGALLKLGPGVYLLNGTLKLRDNMVVIGSGIEKTVLLNNQPVEKNDLIAVYFGNIHNAGLRALTISNPEVGKVKSPPSYSCVMLHGARDCWIEEVCFYNSYNHVVDMDSCYHITMRNNIVKNEALLNRSSYQIINSEYVLACNEVLSGLGKLIVHNSKYTVLYNCYLDGKLQFVMNGTNGVDNLIEGVPVALSGDKRFRLPKTKHGTLFPVTGNCLSSGELARQYGEMVDIDF